MVAPALTQYVGLIWQRCRGHGPSSRVYIANAAPVWICPTADYSDAVCDTITLDPIGALVVIAHQQRAIGMTHRKYDLRTIRMLTQPEVKSLIPAHW